MKLILFFIFSIVSVVSSNAQNRGEVFVEQVESKYSTILFAFEEYRAMTVKFYLTFDVTNNTNEKISIGLSEYIYKGTFLRGFYEGLRTLIPMYYCDKGMLESLLRKDERRELDNSSKQYVFTTLHVIDKKELSKPLFSKYLDKMKSENKDTLHIGTISQLKRENSPLLKLLEGDSIVISFSRNNLYMDPIPVKLK